MEIHVLLWVVAAVLFGIATFTNPVRFSLTAAGLFFLAAGLIAQEIA